MQAKPEKLRNGSWGARVSSARVNVGDTVTITAANGKSWDATVTRVLWHDDSVSLVTTSSSGGHRNARSHQRGDGGPRGNRACYMCGSYYCEGARGGLCEED